MIARVIGVVTAKFNHDVTAKLKKGALDKLSEQGVLRDNIIDVEVPGAFEVPLAAQKLLEEGVDAVVVLGAVIRGETTHYDYVCSAVERGCSQLQLDYGKPVAFGILTTEDEVQAYDRAGGRYGNKGAEAAEVALEMLNLSDEIKTRCKSKLNQPQTKESVSDVIQ